MKKLVIIESPLSGDFGRNRLYARYCLYDSLVNHGEAPFASHLLYPQCLNDEILGHRIFGMRAGFDWAKVADERIVYEDLGISGGMLRGIWEARDMGQLVEYRTLPRSLWVSFSRGIPAGTPTEGF